MATNLILPDPKPGDFSAWSTVTAPTLSLIKDPMKMVARVMMAMSTAQANLLTTMTAKVTAMTDHMADVNELMQMVNNGSAALKAAGEDITTTIFSGSSEKATAIRDRLVANGVPTANITLTTTTTPATITMSKKNLTGANQNLQLTVDTISSSTQQAQLSLQTIMGRYNGTFEVVTSAIKKNETQAESINTNIKK